MRRILAFALSISQLDDLSHVTCLLFCAFSKKWDVLMIDGFVSLILGLDKSSDFTSLFDLGSIFETT